MLQNKRLFFMLGVLLRQAEGEREHHAESEAGGHPERLRQAVSAAAAAAANQSDGFRNPTTSTPSYFVFGDHFLAL